MKKNKKETKPSIRNFWIEMFSEFPNYTKKLEFYCIIFALVIMFFYGPDCLLAQRYLQNEITELEEQKSFYEKEIEQSKKYIYQLKNSKIAQEKAAREKYYVKRTNEEVFILKDISEK